MAYLFLVGWLALAVWASRITGALWAQMLGRVYRVAVGPGVIVHELSHAAACLITGASIKEIHFFQASGGSVVHDRPKVPVIGQPLISMAPILGCGAALWLLAAMVAPSAGGNPLELNPLPMSVAMTPDGLGGFVKAAMTSVWSIADYVRGADFSALQTYLFFYLVWSIATSWGPSGQDLRNSAVGLLVCAVLLALAHFIAATFDKAKGFDSVILEPTSRFVTFAASLLLLLLALTVGLWLIIRAMRLIVSKVGGGGGGGK